LGDRPAILGPEPAYQERCRSALNFIEAQSPAEALCAIEKLKRQPDLYIANVENGYKRATEFTAEQLSLRWFDLLSDPIADGYRTFQKESFLRKHLGRPLRYAFRTLAHRKAVRQYLVQRDQGER